MTISGGLVVVDVDAVECADVSLETTSSITSSLLLKIATAWLLHPIMLGSSGTYRVITDWYVAIDIIRIDPHFVEDSVLYPYIVLEYTDLFIRLNKIHIE